MIKEFAVEPDAITASYQSFAYVIEKFGLYQGRVITKFPKKWKTLVHEAAKRTHTGKVELTRIVERLNALPNDVVFESDRDSGDGTLSWVERAASAQQAQPFDFVLTAAQRNMPSFVPLDQFDEQHECLAQNRQWSLQRNAENIAAVCAFHWKTAAHVKIIDPYFNLDSSSYRRPFERLFALTTKAKNLDIYRSDNFGTEGLRARWSQMLSHATNQGVTVRVFFRPATTMHNRFFLTNLGGLTFGAGLSDDEQNNTPNHDDVSLLERPLREQRWNEFADESAIAEWVPVAERPEPR